MSSIPDTFNISQLEELTGIDRRTISKNLDADKVPFTQGPKNAKLYKPQLALPVLYKSLQVQPSATDADLEQEKLLTARAKRQKAELDLAERQRQVIPINEVCEVVEQEYTVIRAQFRSLPSKLAKHLAVLSEPDQVNSILEEHINEVLTGLQADAESQLQTIAPDDLTPKDEAPTDQSPLSETDSETLTGSVG